MPGYCKAGPPWAHKLFRGHGLRCTLPRDVILNFLLNTEEHLSAEDIYIHIHKKHPDIGLTTVYRTLEVLNRMGIIEKFDFGDRRARYEVVHHVHDKGHHHHIVCKTCGRIQDYQDFMEEETQLIKKIEKKLEQKHNFNITGHMIQFYGLCPECSKKMKKDQGK
ncbi:MAG TPA: Fur family transcriptional regulator [bacterium]|nr:Fur family transcriptional regulator [bacterium]HOL35801.1 Fur family transcriptional regulator [bacterium]HPO52658.1 Fur family transcriptional regulator [bacterium]HXK44491.1 Fur family transcriptional regulator [bacterium]